MVWLNKYQPAVTAFAPYSYVQGTEQTADAAGQTPKGFGEAVAFSKNGNILAVGTPRATGTIKPAPTACGGIVRA
jgi:hypothetical protein